MPNTILQIRIRSDLATGTFESLRNNGVPFRAQMPGVIVYSSKSIIEAMKQNEFQGYYNSRRNIDLTIQFRDSDLTVVRLTLPPGTIVS